MKIMRVILNGIIIVAVVGNKCKQWNGKSRNYNKTCFVSCMYIQGMDGRYSNICFKEVWNTNNNHFYKTILMESMFGPKPIGLL
jgi:hypothetical protein